MSNWTQEFRLKIIALTLEANWWAQYADLIQPEFFENEGEITLVKSIISFYGKYRRPPQLDEILTYISNIDSPKKERLREATDLAERVYEGYKRWELSYARDEVLEFARIQALKIAMLEAIDKIEEGDVEGIDRDISKALGIGIERKSTRLVRDVDEWLYAIGLEDNKIPTGLYHCDLMLDGGLSRGECGVVIAPPNYGKSQALVNIGFGAAFSGFNVAHMTFEISQEKTAKRYGARTAFEWLKRGQPIDEYREKFLRHASRMLQGDIDIFGASPGTVSADGIRRYLDILQQSEFPLDELLLDYADLMKLPKAENTFLQHGENYTRLITIAKDYNLALWTASQSHRGSLRKLTIDLDDIAESFNKAARADVVLTWCQTPEEEDDHEMRFFCAKNRDGLKHWYARCKVHDNAHALVSKEVLWGSDLVQENTEKRKANRQ